MTARCKGVLRALWLVGLCQWKCEPFAQVIPHHSNIKISKLESAAPTRLETPILNLTSLNNSLFLLYNTLYRKYLK